MIYITQKFLTFETIPGLTEAGVVSITFGIWVTKDLLAVSVNP